MDEPDTYEYVVLSDGDTYDGTDSSFVYVLTDVGNDALCNGGGAKDLSEDHIIEKISIADLLDCYFTHETKD